jgi:transcriptional regulator with XRE-family HTH domain
VDLPRLLAESLRRVREEASLTQVEMARRLGISQPTLARVENADQNVTLKTLGRLCRALRCEPGELFRPGQVRVRRPGRGRRAKPERA